MNLIFNSTLDISICIKSYLCRNIDYIAPKFIEDHTIERTREEEGMSLIGGLKSFQDDVIMDYKIHQHL